MKQDDTPWEPPPAGTEQEALFGALERLRATFRYKTDGLGAAGLQTRVGASTLTLGGLLKHLAVAEDYASTVKLSGAPLGEPWATVGWDDDHDWELTSAAHDRPDQLYALWDRAVERSRASSCTCPGLTGAGRTCADSSATSWRSTDATLDMPTFCARPSTAAPARTHHRDGSHRRAPRRRPAQRHPAQSSRWAPPEGNPSVRGYSLSAVTIASKSIWGPRLPTMSGAAVVGGATSWSSRSSVAPER